MILLSCNMKNQKNNSNTDPFLSTYWVIKDCSQHTVSALGLHTIVCELTHPKQNRSVLKAPWSKLTQSLRDKRSWLSQERRADAGQPEHKHPCPLPSSELRQGLPGFLQQRRSLGLPNKNAFLLAEGESACIR